MDFELIARTRATRLPVPLVLHGSSGVADDELRKAVAAGMTKINIGTMLNAAYTSVVRSELSADAEVTDPRRYLAPARAAVARTVAATIVGINRTTQA